MSDNEFKFVYNNRELLIDIMYNRRYNMSQDIEDELKNIGNRYNLNLTSIHDIVTVLYFKFIKTIENKNNIVIEKYG